MDQSDTFLGAVNPLDFSTPTCSHPDLAPISGKISEKPLSFPPSSRRDSIRPSKDYLLDDVELTVHSSISVAGDGGSVGNTVDNIAALGLSFNADVTEATETIKRDRFSLEDIEALRNRSLPLEPGRPFNRWMRDLQKRATRRRKTVSCHMDRPALESDPFESTIVRGRAHHKKSSSGSSFGFVTAVKSASISVASFSIAPRSRRTGVSSRHHRTDRSSKTSNVGRVSEDSSYSARGIVIDQAVANRLLRRRRVLEEIISTEEGYVADVKFLMNVYVTLLASIPTLSSNVRASIHRNLNEIVELHEELLGDLHRVVPHSEYTQVDCPEPILPRPLNGHQRWRSVDAVRENNAGATWLQKIPGLIAEPKVAAEVARVFGKKMNRFFVYEEYGAKYEMMIKDISSTYRTIPQWEVYQKGLEALASSLASINSQHDNSKKSSTIGDLLVKPIQRVCKYPLLFAELLKQTPVCDCPDSHSEIENVLIRLREATTEINRATDDPRTKAILERTWLLQDRLVFAEMPDTRSKNSIRGLGHIHLCGILHVSWQTREGVDGQYLICLLYRHFLLLASAPKGDQVYTVQACIVLSDLRVEEVDNGRGLQCHTAPFSWKLVFEYDHRLFEITMSACSPKEELEWRSRLSDCFCKDCIDAGEQASFTSLSLEIKPMGTVFGKPGTIARRIAIHRATTVGPMSGLCQVIIKNTNASKDIPNSVSCSSINRSQSLLTTNRIPVLAPSRAERIRLESLLSDVWTREVLPFPGMTGRGRSEHLVRASATSMMRKLSVASIASNFTKRSSSIASLYKAAEDDALVDAEMPRPLVRTEHSSSESVVAEEVGETARSRLSVIQDEKENCQQDCLEMNPSTMFGPVANPVGTMRRLATLKVKSRWAHDGQRIVTPPLRTSSANSVNQNRTPMTLSPVPDTAIEEKDVFPGAKSGRSGKETRRNRSVMAEGIRNLFR